MNRGCRCRWLMLLAAGPVAAAAPAQLFVSPGGEPFRAPVGMPYPVAAWFAAADSDGDRRLTRAEYLADAARWFRTLDQNGNQLLDRAEIDHYERQILPEIGRTTRPIPPVRAGGMALAADSAPPPRGRRPAELPRGAALYALIDAPNPVKAADANIDSRVTPDEWQRLMLRRFAVLDPAGAGHLLPDQLPLTPIQQLEARRPARR